MSGLSAQRELYPYQKTKAFNRKGRKERPRRMRRKPVFFPDGGLDWRGRPSLHNFGWIPLLPGGGSGAYDAPFMTSGTAHKHSIRDKTPLTLACATEASLGHP